MTSTNEIGDGTSDWRQCSHRKCIRHPKPGLRASTTNVGDCITYQLEGKKGSVLNPAPRKRTATPAPMNRFAKENKTINRLKVMGGASINEPSGVSVPRRARSLFSTSTGPENAWESIFSVIGSVDILKNAVDLHNG
jgi:hypothetical protein